MKNNKVIFLCTAILLCCLQSQAFAAAFQLYELGSPIIGTAGVGQAAGTGDASTAYFNPAGMTELSHSELMLGAQTAVPKIEFDVGSSNTISGNNGGSAGLLSPGYSTFLAYKYSPQLYFGAVVGVPAVGILDYSDGWVGRYVVQNLNFIALGFNPSVAYKVNDWLSVGGGFTVYYAKLDQTLAIPLPGAIPDGQIEADSLDDLATQFNMGVLVKIPSSKTTIGLAYRSETTFNLKGSTRFLRLAAMPSLASQIKLPQNVIVSISQPVSEKITLLAEGGWANWSVMKATPLQIGGLPGFAIPRNWKDTWRAGLGGQYQVTPALMLQAGISYDSSPTEARFRLPDLPMDEQIRLGTGIVYQVNDIFSVAGSYEYLNLGKAAINNRQTFPGNLVGEYSKNRMQFLQISINAKLA